MLPVRGRDLELDAKWSVEVRGVHEGPPVPDVEGDVIVLRRSCREPESSSSV